MAAVSLLKLLKNFLFFPQGLRTHRKFYFRVHSLHQYLISLSIQIGQVCFYLALVGIVVYLKLRSVLAVFITLAKCKVTTFQLFSCII